MSASTSDTAADARLPPEATPGVAASDGSDPFEREGLAFLRPAPLWAWPIEEATIVANDPVSAGAPLPRLGLTLASPTDALVMAIAAGRVSTVVVHREFTTVSVDHGQGQESTYAFRGTPLALATWWVDPGGPIGVLDRGALAHAVLHLEVRIDALEVDPLRVLGHPQRYRRSTSSVR